MENTVINEEVARINAEEILSDFENNVKGDIAYWCQAQNIEYNEEAIKIYWKEQGYSV